MTEKRKDNLQPLDTFDSSSNAGGLHEQAEVHDDELGREQLLVELRFLRERLANLEAHHSHSGDADFVAGAIARRRESGLHSALDCIITIDREGHILEFNPAAERTFGYRRKEVIGKDMAERIIPPALREAHYTELKHFLQSGEGPVFNQRFEITGMRACGEEFPIELVISPARISGVQIFTTYLRDLSEREKAEAALRQREVKLRQAQNMEVVRQLARGIAHDFNNRLTVILGASEAIQRKPDDEAYVRKWIREVQSASEHAVVMMRQLLALSGQQVLNMRPVDLTERLGAAEAMLSRLLPTTVQIKTCFSPGPLVVEADSSQLNQIILNLALNARDAMPDGGTMTLSNREIQLEVNDAKRLGIDPGAYVVIEVADTGVGMSQDVVQRAFEPFFTTKTAGNGTGLGLATVYGIVKQSLGEVEIESELGTGTVVRLYFPKAMDEGSTSRAAPLATHSRSGDAAILVVDDEKLVRNLVGEILRAEGYQVVLASDGREALHMVEARADKPFELLVSDMLMPNMGGRELALRLKALHPDLSVILMTGYSEAGRPKSFANGDRIYHLDKPFLPNGLVTQVREVLGEKTSQ